MIKFSGTAIIHSISPVMQISGNFSKRELILDASWEKDGKQYPNFVLVEFTGDKMAQLDNFRPGMRVSVEGMLSGREYNERIYNTVKGLSVAPYQTQQTQTPQPAPMPAPGYHQTQDPYQPYGHSPSPTAADLPFPR